MMEVDDNPDSDAGAPHRSKPPSNKVSLSVYPQPFLRDLGHIQAKGTLQLMQPAIQKINPDFAGSLDDDGDDLDDIPFIPNPLVIGICTTSSYILRLLRQAH